MHCIVQLCKTAQQASARQLTFIVLITSEKVACKRTGSHPQERSGPERLPESGRLCVRTSTADSFRS